MNKDDRERFLLEAWAESPPQDVVELLIPSDPRLLRVVRTTVTQMSDLAGFSEEEQKSTALAVDEACSNIIKHAYGGKSQRPILIRCELLGNGLRVRLRDFGRKADLKKIKSRELDDIRPGGLGIHLIRSVMDVVEYDNSFEVGNSLTLVKYLRQE